MVSSYRYQIKLQGLSNYHLVGKFFCGYLAHCNTVNHSILLKLAVNLPSDWWPIVHELWKLGKSLTTKYVFQLFFNVFQILLSG